MRTLIFFGLLLMIGCGKAGDSHEHKDSAEYWTCSMHLSVKAQGPGSCPICGMDLVRKSKPVESDSSTVWTCPMHPSVVSSKPGSCPVCKMDLVKKEKPKSSLSDDDHANGILILSDADQRRANVATVAVSKRRMQRNLSAVGKIEHSEQKIKHVSARITGRVDSLFVDYTGARVHKNQPLFSIYSPQLVSTQEEYLMSIRIGDSTLSAGSGLLRESAERRLKLWGLSNDQILQIRNSGQIMTHMRVLSPYSGTVIHKKVVEGQYVQEGQMLFELVDHRTVWVYSEVFERDLGFVKLGQRVEVSSSAYPGELFVGRITYIHPHFDTERQILRVRAEISSYGHKLKHGMYVNTNIRIHSPGELTVIPATAILKSGKRDLVWIESSPGSFAPREITIGQRYGDYYQVLHGLKPGQLVVTSAGFLIDSESQLAGFVHTATNH